MTYMSIVNPSSFPTAITPDKKLFVIDTGASVTLTNSTADFVSPPQLVQHTELKGITAGLKVKWIGTAVYTFQSDNGLRFDIALPNVLLCPGPTNMIAMSQTHC